MDRDTLVRAFDEWLRRYIADPSAFEAEFQTVLRHLEEQHAGDEPTYGETCAAYLEKVAADLAPGG